ncbi:MAG: response regulator [Bryobacterales bacterium]|nr:response regulator [Bryobacterales bacterium]
MSADRFVICVAEDNPADVYLLRYALTAAGLVFDLKILEDGAEALRFVQDESAVTPDLFILDMNLPKRSGTEVLAAIRRQPALTSVPVAVLTSSASPLDKTRSEELGASHYLQKPLDLDDFLRIGHDIKALLQQASSQ